MRDCVILFAGCSPDDVSVAAHLEHLKETNLRLEGHYWLTHRSDHVADQWAEQNGLARIFFDAQGNCFDGIEEFMVELKKYTGSEEPPPIVVPPPDPAPVQGVPSPQELLMEPSVNKLRQLLNAEAKRILTSSSAEDVKKKEYEVFTTKYEEALHRAWFISTAGGSELFDLQIFQAVKKGSFGQVYEAIDSSGNRVAVKVLHGNVKDDPKMLTCFRRGVAAMQKLSQYNVDGVVPYLRAWEIPTCAVMDFIDGVNLQEAVERGQVNGWYEILRVAHSLAKIIKTAHSTPAGVLHRDLRPANIMLDSKEDVLDRKILVLDFDLCWHHDAADSTSLQLNAEANNGYLSPEQLDPSRHHLTRKPLVDSFGLGMIFYFLLARKHPAINQYMFKSWPEVLLRLATAHTCKEWRSTPIRYTRMIEKCTLNDQSARWDISRIVNEMQLLLDSVSGKRSHVTAELFAEELFCRVRDVLDRYDYLPGQDSIRFQPRDGYECLLRWNERDKSVSFKLQWLQTGSFRFETLRKYITESSEVAAKALRTGGWNEVRYSLSTGALAIDAFVKSDICSNDAAISKAADAIGYVIECLRKLAVKAV